MGTTETSHCACTKISGYTMIHQYKKTITSLLLCLPLTTGVFAQKIEDMQFRTEEYPPYNYIQDKTIKGISIELLNDMFSHMNLKKKPLVNIGAWATAYRLAKDSKAHSVCFSTTRSKEREKLFSWFGPITKTRVSIFTKKGNKDEFTEKDFLTQKFAAIRDDIGEIKLQSNKVPKKNIKKVTSIAQMVKYVSSDSHPADYFAYEEVFT